MSGRAMVPRWLHGTALLVGLAGILVCALGAVFDLDAFARAYFVAVMIAFQAPLGCLALLITWHITGGRWGLVIGDALEAGALTLPLLALLFLPLLVELDVLYPWMRPEYLAEHQTVANKTAYLNPEFFTVRSLAYLAVWIGLALSLTVARRPMVERTRRPAIAIPGAVLFAITVTFASIDWLMSLEPAFNSTTYGLLIMSGQAVAGMALALLITLYITEESGRIDVLREERLLGLGTLLYGLVLLWIYHAAMQLIVIWSGNLPHNAEWYLVRIEGGWRVLAWIIGIGHFAVPFLVLLSARARQSPQVIMALAALMLVMRLLDWLWMIVPAFHDELLPMWLLLGALAAVLGVWSAAFLWLMARRAAWVARAIEASHG